jgi:hypothetical protein
MQEVVHSFVVYLNKAAAFNSSAIRRQSSDLNLETAPVFYYVLDRKRGAVTLLVQPYYLLSSEDYLLVASDCNERFAEKHPAS